MIAKKYKFYLSFENSNCVDYITEKFWDALKYKVRKILVLEQDNVISFKNALEPQKKG